MVGGVCMQLPTRLSLTVNGEVKSDLEKLLGRLDKV